MCSTGQKIIVCNAAPMLFCEKPSSENCPWGIKINPAINTAYLNLVAKNFTVFSSSLLRRSRFLLYAKALQYL